MGQVRSPEDAQEVEIAKAPFKTFQQCSMQQNTKRTNDARTAVNVGVSLVSGEAVLNAHLRNKVAKKLNINRRHMTKGFQRRNRILRGNKHCWTYTERRTRSDAILAEDWKLAHEFWTSPEVSRRTGNKKDSGIRKRIGPNLYVTHKKQVLDMTQTEAFLEFK